MNKENKNDKINKSLFYLLTWFSPSYPIGSYAYSHGLEYAVESKVIKDLSDLSYWISDFLCFGSGYNDGILISCGYNAVINKDLNELEKISQVAKAYKSSKEIALESNQQGISFAHAVSSSLSSNKFDGLIKIINKNISFPLVVACAGATCEISKLDLISAYLHAFVSNIISSALRLMSIGQTESQILLLKFKKEVELLTNKIILKTMNDLGSSVLIGEWSSANHEKQYSRLFRS